jgi:hypothetical protein
MLVVISNYCATSSLTLPSLFPSLFPSLLLGSEVTDEDAEDLLVVLFEVVLDWTSVWPSEEVPPSDEFEQ